MVALMSLMALVAAPKLSTADLDAQSRARIIAGIETEMNANYVFPDVAKKCASHLQAELKAGKYDSIDSPGIFAEALSQALRSISKDKHIRVRYYPERVEVQRDDPRLARQQELDSMRRSNYGFESVEHLEGNIGYLDLRAFSDPTLGRETAAAAMGFLANSEAIIFDVRRNGGGSPEMVQFICSYLFEERTHLNSLYFRASDRTEDFWTLDQLPGKRMPDVPVYVLTSQYTFSAAEEFSYNLQTQGRATLIGETTGGGANPGGTIPIGDGFMMFLPTGRAINPITGTNWEGVGVKPDIEVASSKALEKAIADARDAIRDFREYKAEEQAILLDEIAEALNAADDSFKAGDAQEGTQWIESALELGLEYALYDGQSIDALGSEFIDSGSLTTGIAVKQYNLDVHQDSPEAWFSLGEAYIEGEESGLALSAFQGCLNLNPKHQGALSMIEQLTGN